MLKQADIAEHLDMSQQSVSEWMIRLSINWRDSSLDEIRVLYIRELREQAAGRAASGDLDLAEERAGLARAQKERIEMQNAVTRRELLPAVLIAEVLAKAGSKVAGILDAIPGMVKRRVALSSETLDMIASEVARARNIAAAVTLDDLLDDTEPPDSLPPSEKLDETAQPGVTA